MEGKAGASGKTGVPQPGASRVSGGRASTRGASSADSIDADGFRPNVGIVITNRLGQVLWARRVGGHDAWQFPQGGINDGESPEDALYRELYEEVGLRAEHVKILGRTKGWLRYRLPRRLRRHNSTPGFVGLKQKWFLLELLGSEGEVDVTCGPKPEFDDWRWVSFWFPLNQVVDFKRDVYRKALAELALHTVLEKGR